VSHEAVIGIDGGGSKTLIAMADRSGDVLEMSRGLPINPLDSADWHQILDAHLRPFAEHKDVGSIAAALPAYGEVAAISLAQDRAIADLAGSRPSVVLNDVDAAHIGAFAGAAGILILSGTGSMAWARDAAGKSYRVGGWGDVVGDEGSSHWIGKRVLETISQSIDGRIPRTGLVHAVLSALGIDPVHAQDGIENWAAHLTNSRPQIAALAPLATELAAQGDTAATVIVESAANELARHVMAIARQSGLPAVWSYAGGSFRSELLRDLVAARLGSQPVEPRLPPIGGAILAAAQHLGWDIDESWIARLAASIKSTPADL
jgi:glucosamine kinase